MTVTAGLRRTLVYDRMGPHYRATIDQFEDGRYHVQFGSRITGKSVNHSDRLFLPDQLEETRIFAYEFLTLLERCWHSILIDKAKLAMRYTDVPALEERWKYWAKEHEDEVNKRMNRNGIAKR